MGIKQKRSKKRDEEEAEVEEVPEELLELINPSKKKKKAKKPEVKFVKETDDKDSSDDEEVDDIDSNEEWNTDDEKELQAYLLMDQEKSLDDPSLKIKKYDSRKLALEERLKDIKSNSEWIDTQVITTKGEEVDASDDLKRELRFYQQAQAAVAQALPKLKELGVKTERPEDYFAEMVKSDDLMLRVRKRLVDEKEGIELSEKAKKQRLLKKYGKKGILSFFTND